MAPLSESAILAQFLLAPAQLPTIVSLDDFVALFPRALQSSMHVRALYRDLQRQRIGVLDAVAADIDEEVARGRLLRRYALRARLRADAQEDAAGDDELLIERFAAAEAAAAAAAARGYAAASSPAPDRMRARRDGGVLASSSSHSLASIVAELEAAVQDLQADVELLDDEETRLRRAVEQAVGNLSDLRYGRLANPQLSSEVIEGLENVRAACDVMAVDDAHAVPHSSDDPADRQTST